MNIKRILDFDGKAQLMFPNADEVHSEPDGDPYDAIVITNKLMHTPPGEIVAKFEELAALLVDEGELHIQVPSLEWACREVMARRADGMLFHHMYGEGNRRMAFSLMDLRGLMAHAGLATIHGTSDEYTLAINQHTGEEYKAAMHYVVGIKAKMVPILSPNGASDVSS